MVAFKDETGRRYNKLIAISRASPDKDGTYMWLCRCDCGNTTVLRGSSLRSGATKSCGCLEKENQNSFGKNRTTHGMSYDDLYGIWSGMIRRCEDPKREEYQRYGARGVKVCERWRASFEAFAEDMGARPSKNHSIERSDNTKGYEPGNCCWATRIEQANNMTTNTIIHVDGEDLTLIQALVKYPIVTRDCLQSRLRNGWDPIRALKTPSRRSKSLSNL